MACNSVRQSFKTLLMNRFMESIQEGNGDSLFLAIAKTTAWNDENNPPTPLDTIEEETDFWRECIALKKVKTEDIALVLPRYNWANGTVYDSYEDDVDLFDDNTPKQFFVLVDERRIYKVIDNNGGVSSTTKPQETGSTIFKTADGYSWKFIYQIAESDLKFLTDSYMPVFTVSAVTTTNDPRKQQFDVQNAAIDGSIDFIQIDEVGTAFPQTIDGVSSGTHIVSGTTGTASQYRLAGTEVSLVSGVYLNYALKLNDPDSSNYGEIRKITAYDGSSRTVTLETDFTDPLDVIGYDFTIIPSIGISGDGTGASAEAKMTSANFIESIDMISRGSSYTYAFANAFGGSTSAADAVLDPIISPKNGHGSNAIEELGSASIMVSVDLDQTEDGLIQGNSDFRQFGLISNPEIGGTVVGTTDDIIHSYFVTSTSPINDFDGLVTNGSSLIGHASGESGRFYKYVATIGNALNGVVQISNPTDKFEKGDRLVIANADYTNGTLTKVAIDRFVGEQLVINKDVYRQTTQFTVSKIATDFTDVTFEEDLTVRGSSSGATAIVSSWDRDFITGGTYSTNSGVLEVVRVTGTFNTDDTLSQISATGVETLDKASVTTLNTPEIDYHSGDLLYHENIQVLERDDNQREEIKIILSI